jgi:hypothetical protein
MAAAAVFRNPRRKTALPSGLLFAPDMPRMVRQARDEVEFDDSSRPHLPSLEE